jgi:hypothetical protein
MAVEKDGLLLGVVSELAQEDGGQLQLSTIRPGSVKNREDIRTKNGNATIEKEHLGTVAAQL